MKERPLKIIQAVANVDWQQVVANGGPPCFFVEDGRFCLRAERWAGHRPSAHNIQSVSHAYVSLDDLLNEVSSP